jgi:hypothetical protein
MNSLPISRRDFLGGALAASSLVAAGLPARALATGDPTPVNVRVSHDGRDEHGEPCLAVNPRNPRNLLAACMQVEAAAVATYASFDGGRTWRSNGPLPVPASTPVGNDVSAGFDGAGRGFVCGLLNVPPSPTGKGAQRAVNVWRTDDGGRTFTAPVAVTELGALDRPWLAAEPRWPHAVHVVWSQGATAFLSTDLAYARSTDGGRTFEAPRTIARATGGLGTPVVASGPAGSVYVIYAVGSTAEATSRRTPAQPHETPATVIVLCSHDRGQTFERPVELGRGTIDIAFPHTYSDSLPAIAADPDSGLVCAVFTVHEAPGHADILLAASRDGGRTWSRAKAVTPQDQVIYFQPQVAIDAAGRIGVMAFAMTHGKVSVVLMLSEPNSLRFGPPITVTHQPFDPTKSGRGSRWWIGDYQALATTPGAFHPLWNDTRTGQLQLFTAAVRVGS